MIGRKRKYTSDKVKFHFFHTNSLIFTFFCLPGLKKLLKCTKMFGCYYRRTTQLPKAVYNSLMIMRIIFLICMAAPKHFFDLSVCFFSLLFILSPDRGEEIIITKIHHFSGWDESVLVIHPYKQGTVYGNNAVFHCNQSRPSCKLLFTQKSVKSRLFITVVQLLL